MQGRKIRCRAVFLLAQKKDSRFRSDRAENLAPSGDGIVNYFGGDLVPRTVASGS